MPIIDNLESFEPELIWSSLGYSDNNSDGYIEVFKSYKDFSHVVVRTHDIIDVAGSLTDITNEYILPDIYVRGLIEALGKWRNWRVGCEYELR